MLAGPILALMLFAPGAAAQTPPADAKPAETKPTPETYRTIYLTNIAQQNDANDVQNVLRNMLPKTRIYYVASQGAITLRGSQEDMQIAQKIVSDLDRVKKIYRLTYTITEIDGDKHAGAQKFSLIVASGSRTDFKQGSRVPIVTGVYEDGKSTPNTQVQYQDVGLSIEAWLDGYVDGLRLHSKVEQSSVAEEKSGVGSQDPVLHQTVLEGTSTLVQGKPLVLGSLDEQGAMRRREIEVVAELVR
jgi:type II secretory pathway component GspD/PulD (secretin)